MTRLGVLGAVFFFIACSPTVGEEDEGVGSNTNWYRACDTDAECGAELGCLCGTCTKACSEASDCEGEVGSVCPVDRSAYAAACGPRAALDAPTSACFQACETNADCPGSRLCVAGGCAAVEHTPCDDVAELSLSASSPQLRARVGALFADEYYLPQWYAGYPAGWTEPYQPSTLTARLTDDAGDPVEGCEVQFFAGRESGHAFAHEPVSDETGEVTALWVAGPAQEQTLQAAVHSGTEWLFAEIEGEARGHDEEPQATGPEARDFTSPSGLVVTAAPSEPATEVRVSFTPLTFPARVTYTIIDTDLISVAFTNDGDVDAEEGDVPASDRQLTISIYDQAGAFGGVVALLNTGFCTQDSAGFGCAFDDAWQPGENIEVRVEAQAVALGESPSDYDPQTHSTVPCDSDAGCTDFSLFVRRAGEGESLYAVLRGIGAEDFSDRSLYIGGVYTPEIGIASTCLQTKRASFVALHETFVDDAWAVSEGGSSFAFHESWQNQTCANYAAFETPEGYYLSTGGPSPISTPSLPGVSRDL